ncbi:MAG: M1 family metallopeptidase [Acidobacteria bacterium]|nr:M1 family metallopeptidase [Acidobacteriota bacterium]
MKLKRRVFLATLAAALLLSAFSVLAQNRTEFDRPQTFDAQHYTIRVAFDRSQKKVLGDTTVSVKPLKPGFRTLELDAVGLAFESVALEPTGSKLEYKTAEGKVIVTLDRAYGPEETIAVRFKYSASPKKGIYFVDASNGENGHSAQIWTQGEPDEARHWFPSFDFPSDKATTEELITADKGETVIGNGEFLGKVDAADGKETWHFKMPVPHSTYLVSFIVGKYSRVDDQYRGIPLGSYVYPGREKTAQTAFGPTKEMMQVFEEVTGVLYPYNKYDQTIVAKFQFGGMENITATTMADSEIFFGDFEFGKGVVTDLVSHELAHSWFGNLVTCRNWAELWLNEGFATYMEAVYRERKLGRDAYVQKVQMDADEFLGNDSMTGRRHGLYNLRAGEVDKLFDNASVTYNKGGVVLHMLREQVGTENFWKAVNVYLNRHKFAGVGTEDLKTAMEQASGQDLDWFFDQWVYHSGAPRLSVTSKYSAAKKTITITVTQTQKADAIVPAAFRLPLEFEVDTASGPVNKDVEVTKRTETFTIKLRSKPTLLKLVPDFKTPAKTVKIAKIVYAK